MLSTRIRTRIPTRGPYGRIDPDVAVRHTKATSARLLFLDEPMGELWALPATLTGHKGENGEEDTDGEEGQTEGNVWT